MTENPPAPKRREFIEPINCENDNGGHSEVYSPLAIGRLDSNIFEISRSEDSWDLDNSEPFPRTLDDVPGNAWGTELQFSTGGFRLLYEIEFRSSGGPINEGGIGEPAKLVSTASVIEDKSYVFPIPVHLVLYQNRQDGQLFYGVGNRESTGFVYERSSPPDFYPSKMRVVIDIPRAVTITPVWFYKDSFFDSDVKKKWFPVDRSTFSLSNPAGTTSFDLNDYDRPIDDQGLWRLARGYPRITTKWTLDNT